MLNSMRDAWKSAMTILQGLIYFKLLLGRYPRYDVFNGASVSTRENITGRWYPFKQAVRSSLEASLGRGHRCLKR
jgi:hypothetical protein